MSRNARISLISLYNTQQLSLRPIHSFLKAQGHEVQLLYLKDYAVNHFVLPTHKELDSLTGLLRTFSPDLIGLCVSSSMTFPVARDLTVQIRKHMDCPVIWGGVHPSVCPEQCIEVADIVCRLDGELTLHELLTNIRAGVRYSAIPNLWIRERDGIIKNPIRELESDFSYIPLPDFSNEGQFYIEGNRIRNINPLKSMQWEYMTFISKGCLFTCSYCIHCALNQIPPTPRIQRKTLMYALDELERMRAHCPGVGQVTFCDQIFLTDEQELEFFIREYKQRINLPFYCMYRPETLTPRIARLLKAGGVGVVNVGLQSGSERIRREIYNRHDSNEQLEHMASVAHNARLPLRIDLLFDNPYETEADKQELLNLLSRLPKPFELSCFALSFFPRVTLTERALADGKITADMVEDRAQKGMRQWAVSFDYPRSTDNVFWISIISLMGKRWIPNRVIRALVKQPYVRVHPEILRPIIRASSLIRWITKGIPVLLRGHATFHLLTMIIRKRRYIFTASK